MAQLRLPALPLLTMATLTCRSDAASQIKSSLSMRQVAEHYGFAPNQAGFISCPFHQADDTPSMKIYSEPGRGFHCHACGAGSSVIDFVMRLFDITYPQALVRLSADFGLGLTDRRPDMREAERLRRERAARERDLAAYRKEYDAKCREHQMLWEMLQSAVEDAGTFRGWALGRLDYLQFWFEQHPYK